jgi:hypothetical protein
LPRAQEFDATLRSSPIHADDFPRITRIHADYRGETGENGIAWSNPLPSGLGFPEIPFAFIRVIGGQLNFSAKPDSAFCFPADRPFLAHHDG